jgi:translation initiation factor 5B
MTANIIYHLFDQFTRFMDEVESAGEKEASAIAVFPVSSDLLPQHIFNQKTRLLWGWKCGRYSKVGTPFAFQRCRPLHWQVESIETGGEQGQLEIGTLYLPSRLSTRKQPTKHGRQFDSSDMLYSQLTRASIDALKSTSRINLKTTTGD